MRKLGGRGEETRVICRDFAGKVKKVMFTLPSVRRARQHRRRKSSEAALVQTFLVLRQAWSDVSHPPGPGLLPQRSNAARLLDSTSQ